MASITRVAEAFFDACETGKGWEGCRAYCAPDATFSAQAEPLLDVRTLEQYTEWMKGLLTVLPDGRYELKLPYSVSRELLMDVLHYGSDAEIVEPTSLREQAKALLSLALSNYE